MTQDKTQLGLGDTLKYHAAKTLMRPALKPSINRRYKREAQEQPAIILQEKHKLSGIGQHYHLPEDKKGVEMDAETFEKNIIFVRDALHLVQEVRSKTTNPPKYLLKLEADYSNQLRDWVNEVVKKNRDIAGIDRLRSLACTEHAQWNILMGCSSGFNTKDIEWFVTGNNGQSSNFTAGYAKAKNQLRSNIGELGFVPSPSTLKSMGEQVSNSPEHVNLDPKHSFSANGNTGPQELALLEMDGKKQLIKLPPSKPMAPEQLTQSHILSMRERTEHYWQKLNKDRQQQATEAPIIR